jgi:hypothetical protein
MVFTIDRKITKFVHTLKRPYFSVHFKKTVKKTYCASVAVAMSQFI